MNKIKTYSIVFLLAIILVSLFISSVFGSRVNINGVFQIEGADTMGNGHIPPSGSKLKDDLQTYLNDINLGNADLTTIEKKLNTQPQQYPLIQGNTRAAINSQLSAIDQDALASQIKSIVENAKLN